MRYSCFDGFDEFDAFDEFDELDGFGEFGEFGEFGGLLVVGPRPIIHFNDPISYGASIRAISGSRH